MLFHKLTLEMIFLEELEYFKIGKSRRVFEVDPVKNFDFDSIIVF